MPHFEAGPLPKKLPELHKESQVEKAVLRHKQRSEEKLPNTPQAKIDTYLNRLEAVFGHTDETRRKRNIELFKPILHREFVISRENFPKAYFELQKKIAREQGQGDLTITPEMERQMIEVVREDQTKSLDDWVDYLTSEDAGYPAWFKYFAFRNIIKLSQFDKERGHFKKRSKDTTAPYPDIYREPLAIVADKLQALANNDLSKFENDEEFKSYAEGKFPDLYAKAIQATLEASLEGRENTQGKWVVYSRGDMTGADKLYQSLQGKGTGWCTAGKSTAESQINQGDFYVYYSYKESTDTVPSQPRIAIRMRGDHIAEVRGILPSQAVEPVLQEIVDEKLRSFGDKADAFMKKSADMKKLTEIYSKSFPEEKDFLEKMAFRPELTDEELEFLYELNGEIKGFGYNKDPRIEEIISLRNQKEDYYRIFKVDNDEDLISALVAIEPKTTVAEGIIQRIFPEAENLSEQNAYDLITWNRIGGDYLVASNLDKFPTINVIELTKRLLKLHRGNQITENLESFVERDPQILKFLIQQGYHPEELLKYLAEEENPKVRQLLFQELMERGLDITTIQKSLENAEILEPDKKYMLELIKTSKKDYIRKHIRDFTGLDTEVALKLIDIAEIETVLSNLEVFENLDKGDLLDALLKTKKFDWGSLRKEKVSFHRLEALAHHLDKFPELNHQQFANLLLQEGEGNIVSQYFQNFKGVDHEQIANQLLDSWQEVKSFLKNVKKFNIDKGRVVQELFKRGRGIEVGDHIENFPEQYHNSVALELLEHTPSDELSFVTRNLSKFKQLSKEVAQRLISMKQEEVVAQNLKIFVGLDQEIAEKLIEAGKGWTVMDSVEMFKNIDEKRIVQVLLVRKEFSTIGDFIEKFTSLDTAVALELIKNGKAYDVMWHPNSFDNIDGQQIAEALLSTGQGPGLIELGLDKGFFNNTLLQESVAGALLERGYGKYVLKHRDGFETLSPSLVEKLESEVNS